MSAAFASYSGFAAFLDPSFNVSPTPYAALGEIRDGLREAIRAGELVGSLAADAEHLANLSGTDEIHARSVGVSLDTVKTKGHTPIDTVKRSAR